MEYIEIDWPSEVSFPQLLSLFKNPSKLRYFFINDVVSIRLWSDLEYRELFQVCPSLRVLDHMICSTASFIQLKDALTNDIIKLNRSEYGRSYFISEKYEYYNPYE